MISPLSRRFILNGIEVICSIGIHDFERETPQRITVDIEVLLALDAEPQADTIDLAVNYDDIRQAVVSIATSRHFDLQETLARTIFDALAAMDGIEGVSVRTAKPDVYKDVAEAAYQLSSLHN
jgi:dihydroneopterin aldolase